MLEELIKRIKTRQFNMYSQYFSFFQSKTIQKIITSKKIHHVILYRDLQFLDDETEYLKRTYHQVQAFNRIKKLINYYEKNMTLPAPILLTIEEYQYLENRNRKILKLCIIKEKSLAEGQKQRRKSFLHSKNSIGSNPSGPDNDILPKIDTTNLQDAADSDRDQSDEQSFDSQAHDMYKDYKQKANEIYSMINGQQYKQILSIKSIIQSALVINFKINQPPSGFNNVQNQMKIVASQPPMNGQSGLRFSKNAQKQIQYIPAKSSNYRNSIEQQPNEQYQSQQSQSNKQRNSTQLHNLYSQPAYGTSNLQNVVTLHQAPSIYQQPNKFEKTTSSMINSHQAQIASNLTSNRQDSNQYKNNIDKNYHKSTNCPNYANTNKGFNARQQQQNGNLVGNIHGTFDSGIGSGSASHNTNIGTNINSATSPGKKQKLSFMQYYHSAPIKNPTNILQKYLKRKK